MKKPTAILLALSLLANLALAIVVVRTGALSAFVLGNPKNASAQTHSNPGTPADAQAAADAIVAAAKTGDAKTLLTLLEAAGLDVKTAGFMSFGLEVQKFAEQAAALMPKGPYWRNKNPADFAKVQRLSLDFNNRMQDLVPDLYALGSAGKYDYLDPDRRAKLLSLERDYNQLTAETNLNTNGFKLQSDTDKLKAIADERKREIDSFLTPDEIAARDMRESPTAKHVRNNYGNIIDNEAEYQAAYAIMQAAGDDQTAQEAARAQVEAMLGPDRMAKCAQMNDPDYALIQTAADRLNLPPEATTASLMAIRDQASQSAADIAADTTLTAAQRKAALQDLAAKSQEQIGGVLGTEGAAAFAKSSKWMDALSKGSTFRYSYRGKFQTK